MKTDSTLSRFIFTSFWPLLVFLIIPFLFILNIRFHLQLPLAGNKSSVLYNNACLSVFIALRVIYYLRGLTRTIRYGADSGIPKAATETDRSVSEIKSRLTESGFQFDNAGSYAEKQDRGYLGTTLLYAGLFIVIFTGTLDNMRQFSGTFLHGVGMALDLNTNDRYRALATGPLTTEPTTLPKMKIMSHILPDATYPLGAAEVVFINPTGKEQKVILKAPDPYRAGNFDIYMARMLYEPTISVSIDGAIPVYNGRIMLKPLAAKVDDFGFYTSFVDGNLDGEVYYQPEKSRLKMVLRQGSNALMDKELIFQVERRQTMGNISFTVERMGVWSEIHVVQRRHMPVVFIGGVLALIGFGMRLYYRPQRVWLEEAAEGCRVRFLGRDGERRLKVEG